jgi:hypothetical protein
VRRLNSGIGIGIDIPDFEPFRFFFEKRRIDTWVKYFGETNEQLDEVCLLLWSIKPFFKRLDVHDDEGYWYDFAAKRKNERFPTFRELSDIEVAEYNRGFDLPHGTAVVFNDVHPLFPLGNAPAVLVNMVYKDMNPNLSELRTKEDLFKDMDERVIRFGPPDEKLEDSRELVQFEAVVENWILKKLINKQGQNYGETYINKSKACNDWANFSWLMREILYRSFGGILSAKHSKLHRFVDKLLRDGYSFEDEIVFLRFIYSTLEYLGIYRPASLIERTK